LMQRAWCLQNAVLLLSIAGFDNYCEMYAAFPHALLCVQYICDVGHVIVSSTTDAAAGRPSSPDVHYHSSSSYSSSRMRVMNHNWSATKQRQLVASPATAASWMEVITDNIFISLWQNVLFCSISFTCLYNIVIITFAKLVRFFCVSLVFDSSVNRITKDAHKFL